MTPATPKSSKTGRGRSRMGNEKGKERNYDHETHLNGWILVGLIVIDEPSL